MSRTYFFALFTLVIENPLSKTLALSQVQVTQWFLLAVRPKKPEVLLLAKE